MRPLLLALAFVIAAPAQRMVTQTYTLADTPAAVQTFKLLNTPIAGTRARIIVMFRSSQVGADVVYSVPPGLANAKTLDVTVPVYRPFLPQDVLTIFYWTFDP